MADGTETPDTADVPAASEPTETMESTEPTQTPDTTPETVQPAESSQAPDAAPATETTQETEPVQTPDTTPATVQPTESTQAPETTPATEPTQTQEPVQAPESSYLGGQMSSALFAARAGEDVYELNADTVQAAGITSVSADTKAGTNDYFTLTKNIAIDSNSKTFTVDGESKTISYRMKSGGDSSASARGINFTVSSGKTAKIFVCAASSSGSADARLLLCSQTTGAQVSGTDAKDVLQGVTTVAVFDEIPAGDYYLASQKADGYTGNVNFYYVKVIETNAVTPPTVSTASAQQSATDESKVTVSFTGTAGEANSSYEVEASKDGGTTWIKTGQKFDGTKTEGSVTVDLSAETLGYGTWKFRVTGANSVTASEEIAYIANTYVLSGTYTGLGSDAGNLTSLVFEPVTPSNYRIPAVTLSSGSYSIELEIGTTYQVKAEGVNDYAIKVPAGSFTYNENTTLNIEFEKKPTYAVTVNLGSTPDLSGKSVSYSFTHTEGDVYTFADKSSITLRDGTYQVALGGDFEQMAYKIARGASLTVNGGAATLNITFDPVTSWSFVGADGYNKRINGTSGYYQGLAIDATTGKLEPNNTPPNSAQFNTGAKISVPVTGKCTIAVTAYQAQYALYTIGGTAASTTEVTTTYEYTAETAGTVDIVSTGSAYIAGIVVTYPAKEVQFVAQTAMPFVPADDADANTAEDTDGIPRASKNSSLVVQPEGQKLKLTQTGGNFNQTFSQVANVGYYLFPMTTDENTLEFDVLITGRTGSSNEHGFFGGIFTNNYVYSLGLRKGEYVRGVYSKNGGLSGGNFAGAGSPNEESIGGLNVPVHYTIKYVGGKADVTITFTNEEGVQTRNFSQGKVEETETKVYYGFALSQVSATVTNMKYTAADGTVLYDQNNCYYAEGSAPVVNAGSVAAAAAESREYIDVSWTGTLPENDGTYVVEMQKDGGEWVELSADVTDMTYRYTLPAGEGGSYLFRVCGQLGKGNLGGTRNAYVTMAAPIYVVGALERPVVSISASASQISLDWQDVAGAEYYLVYRYSFDEGEENAAQIAQVTASEYVDTNVTAEMPYYYMVKAVNEAADNESPFSSTVWQVPSAGHSGDYAYESEAAEIVLTKKSYDTVFDGNVVMEGVVDGVGTLEAYVNGSVAATAEIPSARDTFSFNFAVEQGRNDVELIFTAANGKKTRKAYNYVYLTNYEYIVDANFTGTDGDADPANGNDAPVYKTIQAAVDAASRARAAGNKVIFVKAGSYEERLTVNTPNISIIGEDREMTRIHCYPADILNDTRAEAGGDMDKRCAIYIQSGATGFSAENVTFANDYVYGTPDGKSNKSADALRCEADQSSFVNVKFEGVQDTLYMHSGKQYYYKCRIEGLIDFIYSGDDARSYFEDCEIVFVYESTKTSGYVSAPKTAKSAEYGLIFNNCSIIGEEGCNGTEYLLARPWGPDGYITWINCYMGKVVNATAPYGAMNGNMPEDARFYEFGSYGPGYEINANRRQISPSKAQEMISAAYLGWNPADTSEAEGEDYVGTVTTTREPAFVEQTYTPTTHVWASGDDTGLAMYDMEGYAQNFGVSGGGLLLETNENYYKVGTAEEFLDAFVAVKASGKNSVIELTDDIALGCNEVNNFASYSSVIKAYSAQALTHPKLKESGVSILSLEKMHNLTIFSQNGSSILHANITMKNASNIMIRNIKFDELWEWDEATAGDYDRNDWDYMTIDSGCDGIWIDHCTFYKAYDGVIDVKNPNPLERVTISWCEFLPGSENDTFFDQMMNYIYENPSEFPTTYQHLKDEGMTDSQIRWYAYGQKKTHLFGQADDATNAAGIRVTLANNYYKNSMDRMPRLRFGYSHVYNCIMDSQDLLDAKYTISNADVNKKIVSNGASSTCGAQVLLENCYISGIQNALNSGNGSSPKGYIGAVDSVYYMDGKAAVLEPKCNSSAYPAGEPALVTDADAFRAALPYSGYHLYNAKALDQILLPGSGAGKLSLTVLQWEKTSYNADYVAPEVTIPVDKDADDDDDDDNGGSGSADDAEVIVNVDWNAVANIIDEAAKTKKPQNVDIQSGDRFEVPVNVLNKLVGTKVTLALHAGGGLTFSISGSDIKRTKASFKMAVSRASVIPENVANQVLSTATAYKMFSMEEKVAYPFLVNVHVNLGAENAGKMAYMYYYDEASGSMRLSGSFRVTAAGQAMFALTRGDEYIIVVAGGPVTMSGKYIVVKGDNLSHIAKKVGTTLRNIIMANPQIKDINMIHPGQEINVP